jgi:hypothetical protein
MSATAFKTINNYPLGIVAAPRGKRFLDQGLNFHGRTRFTSVSLSAT